MCKQAAPKVQPTPCYQARSAQPYPQTVQNGAHMHAVQARCTTMHVIEHSSYPQPPHSSCPQLDEARSRVIHRLVHKPQAPRPHARPVCLRRARPLPRLTEGLRAYPHLLRMTTPLESSENSLSTPLPPFSPWRACCAAACTAPEWCAEGRLQSCTALYGGAMGYLGWIVPVVTAVVFCIIVFSWLWLAWQGRRW